MPYNSNSLRILILKVHPAIISTVEDNRTEKNTIVSLTLITPSYIRQKSISSRPKKTRGEKNAIDRHFTITERERENIAAFFGPFSRSLSPRPFPNLAVTRVEQRREDRDWTTKGDREILLLLRK